LTLAEGPHVSLEELARQMIATKNSTSPRLEKMFAQEGTPNQPETATSRNQPFHGEKWTERQPEVAV